MRIPGGRAAACSSVEGSEDFGEEAEPEGGAEGDDEMQFGLRLALREWPQNQEARRSLNEAAAETHDLRRVARWDYGGTGWETPPAQRGEEHRDEVGDRKHLEDDSWLHDYRGERDGVDGCGP